MTAQELLKELGDVLGIEVAFDEENVCRIIFDEDVVDFEVVGTSLALFSAIGPVPLGNREQWYEQLLSGNFFGRETDRASLGLDVHLGTVYLHRILDMPMEYPAFESALESFVKVARHWKNKFRLRSALSMEKVSSPGAPSRRV